MTSLAECTDVPWRSRFASDSRPSCMVLNMVAPGGRSPVNWGCADSSADRVKRAWSTTAPFGHGRRAIGRRPDDDQDHQYFGFSLWVRKCAREQRVTEAPLPGELRHPGRLLGAFPQAGAGCPVSPPGVISACRLYGYEAGGVYWARGKRRLSSACRSKHS